MQITKKNNVKTESTIQSERYAQETSNNILLSYHQTNTLQICSEKSQIIAVTHIYIFHENSIYILRGSKLHFEVHFIIDFRVSLQVIFQLLNKYKINQENKHEL